jgi:hypothetical protein
MSMKHALRAPLKAPVPHVSRAQAANDAPAPGKFTRVLRPWDGGRWLNVSDMDNSNVPVQPVPPRPPQLAGAQTP